METYCVLIETRYTKTKKMSEHEIKFARAIGYHLSRWKKLSHETKLRKMIQAIFDGEDSRIHVLKVMQADTETAQMHKAS